MTNATEEYFDELGRRGREERLAMATGTVRCDLTHGRQTDHWLIKIQNGNLAVTREDAKADAVVRADRALFDRIATGEMNLTSAFYRGALVLEGDFELICVFERLFPGPPVPGRRAAASHGRASQPDGDSSE